MKKICFLFVLLIFNQCYGQMPFSDIQRRPNVHPYTFLGPNSNAMDYQQMFYLREKYENLNTTQNLPLKNKTIEHIYVNPKHINIRPTGHKTYFMIIP